MPKQGLSCWANTCHLKTSLKIVVPSEIMDGLLTRILQVRSYVVAATALVSLVTLLVMALVIMLSIRLRRREIVTMNRMGCSRFAIAQLLASQILIIVVCSGLAALAMTLAISAFGHEIVRYFVI